jgi:quercetin dioxygenase-like cupin family protein
MNKSPYFDYLISVRDKERRRRQKAKVVARGAERPVEENAQGILRWYMHPIIEDTPTKFYLLYVQEIPAGGKSGKLVVPGGQIIYIWQGTGRTVLDGETFEWKEGDALQLPVRVEGVTFQHFNTDTNVVAKLIVAEPNFIDSIGVDKGSKFEVLEEAPKYMK